MDHDTNTEREVDRVEQSAKKLYERLNPSQRDPEIADDAPNLPIYDWEIASDAGVEIDDVRTALQTLDGRVVALRVVNHEHYVIALTQAPVDNAA